MTRREQRELIQRWHDGEVLGAEERLAARLVDDDPDAMAWLESIERLGGGLREDIEAAVQEEDFGGYWDAIADRLPSGPMTLEPDDGLVRHPPEAISVRRRPLRWLLRPLSALAALMLVAALLQLAPEPAPPSYVVEIVEVDSGGAVEVVEATVGAPMMVSFVESAS